jgi:hypothetical protein
LVEPAQLGIITTERRIVHLPAKVVRLGLIIEYCSCSGFKVAL